MTLETELEGVQRLGTDTAPLIYFIEGHPKYRSLVRVVFERAETGEIELFTSTVTLTEVLAHPLEKQAEEIAKAYKTILLESPHLHVLDVNVRIAEKAAKLRARYRLKTPDAIQIAVAIQAGCEGFLTNDKDHKRVQEVRVLFLGDFLA
ncbi:MAG TPA: PIN domain-containing protein [Thermoanaerobaculia bacterium]|nr:PIN domain-containing protein [Thermoanaerobaculia bacterium]